jgi:glycosyltransferase involved in cell wall biosynthesis
VRVVLNGVDAEVFRPQDDRALRTEVGIPPAAPLVGLVASIKPQKNHLMFLDVARRVLGECPDAHFLCVGDTLTPAGAPRSAVRPGAGMHGDTVAWRVRVLARLQELGLEERVHWLPHTDDMPAVYNACDLTVLTSHHEGTPNVVLESMACGVPAVVTDVADNGRIIDSGVTGFVVAPEDAATMAERVLWLLADAERRRGMGAAARRAACRRYAVPGMARAMAAVYQALLSAAPGNGRAVPTDADELRPLPLRSVTHQ